MDAWLQARQHDCQRQDANYYGPWPISVSDISSTVEAALKLNGPAAALDALGRCTPKRVALDVALTLPYRLIAEGYGDNVGTLATGAHLEPIGSFFVFVPLA